MSPLAFEPLRRSLYTFEELHEGTGRAGRESYGQSKDFRIYLQYLAAGSYAPADAFMAMAEVMHDNAIRLATEEYLRSIPARAAVAVMGGHDLPRNSPVYAQVAFLCRDLARRGFLPISGGGPGAMEATHLGALHQHASAALLRGALAELGRVPTLPANLQRIVDKNGRINRAVVARIQAWLKPAYRVRSRVTRPGESLAVPTWLYGHEPTTLFATRIAKYFQNSVREDRLLAIATHGVIYFEGKAGTLQEVFQDAAQNFYRVLGDFSPMVFFGRQLWTETLPVVPLVRKLLGPEDFARYICVTDDPAEVLRFLQQRPRRETPSQRMVRSRRSEQASGLPGSRDRGPAKI